MISDGQFHDNITFIPSNENTQNVSKKNSDLYIANNCGGKDKSLGIKKVDNSKQVVISRHSTQRLAKGSAYRNNTK